MQDEDGRVDGPSAEAGGVMAETRERRRLWPWIVGVVLTLVVLLAAWFIGEIVVRDIATKIVKEKAAEALDLSSDDVDVDLGAGMMIPQLLAQRLDSVRLSSDAITIGELSGAVAVRAEGVTFEGVAEEAAVTVRLDQEQVTAIVASLDDVPIEDVKLTSPDVAVATSLPVLGITIPLELALHPGVDAGDLLLRPVSLTLGGSKITAEALEDRFGQLVAPVVRDWRVCLADQLPAGVSLTEIEVTDDLLVLRADLAGRIAVDAELQEPGTCP